MEELAVTVDEVIGLTRGDKLGIMSEDRRDPEQVDRRTGPRVDRRARTRGGRRDVDGGQPWWMRRRLWLAFASVMYVGWRRVVGSKVRP
jgi:hypothetical protein